MVNFKEDKQQRKLELLRAKEEEESIKIFAKTYRLPYLDLSRFPIEIDAIQVIPEPEARTAEVAAFQRAGRKISIAVRNPEKPEAKTLLDHLKEQRYNIDLYLVSKRSLEHAWEYYKKVPEKYEFSANTIQLSHERLNALREKIKSIADIKKLLTEQDKKTTTAALEIILAGALGLAASDIHIETGKENARIRFRLDGVLNDVATLSQKLYTLLLSRIKLISELKLNLRDRAQDGRFTIHTDVDIEVRTSTLPGPEGENIVLRVLNPTAIEITFEELGMQPWVAQQMERELRKPNGMILTTGPTGSGKTTTLYTFLKKIHTPAIKIITIEDPIEYHINGIEQTQVDAEKGYDFAGGLRSIVRQDPDAILVGEIRDLETAETAMHAALTGHLVFSTLHTNNAAGTIPRLLDLGVKPAIIAPAINVSMAQRLVRKLCSECRIAVELSAEDRKRIEKELDAFPKDIPLPQEWTLFTTKQGGCGACHGLGYRGRIGIYEIILITKDIESLILKNPSEFEIQKEAAKSGNITMRQDALLKVLAGVTDFAELERVIGVE